MIPRVFWAYFAAFYFALQSVGAAFWWLILWLEPSARPLFRPSHTPDSALFSFFLPDAALYVGAGLWAATSLAQSPRSARVPLALHLGAAFYVALYCIAQTLLTGEAVPAAILMTAGALCGGFLSWKAAFSGE